MSAPAIPAAGRPRVSVTEVGTRDGFQAEPVFIATGIKAQVIDALVGAGARAIEATSFVSPKAVPQLADA
ncbi:MAG: hydroxymethylglutaryl-CoA lyase, partial [Burkholderiales bacterium]|nr:hydroxymethylglutaryl-CoA lyase [Burkholderiales bacterium]